MGTIHVDVSSAEQPSVSSFRLTLPFPVFSPSVPITAEDRYHCSPQFERQTEGDTRRLIISREGRLGVMSVSTATLSYLPSLSTCFITILCYIIG